jgi:hypothetical protein
LAEVALTGNRLNSPRVLEFGKGTTLRDIERFLPARNNSRFSEADVRLRIETPHEDIFLTELWAAIAIGTWCRVTRGRAAGVTPVSRSWPVLIESSLVQSLSGLAALQMASKVISEVDESPIDAAQIERIISLSRKGILETGGHTSRTLIEFDPQQPLAKILQDKKLRYLTLSERLASQRRLFRQLLIKFRSELELGRINREIELTEHGHLRQLSTFLVELHDNAYEHGRMYKDQAGKGMRFLRIRNHIGDRQQLRKKTGRLRPLDQYIADLPDFGPQILVEVNASDFGMGVVDHFLSSSNGRMYSKMPRRELLDALLTKRLTSKPGDPSAGLGIQKALAAAREMAGFVSLRTGEFWLVQSFSRPGAELSLADIYQRTLAPVAGTHWQFFYPQPL